MQTRTNKAFECICHVVALVVLLCFTARAETVITTNICDVDQEICTWERNVGDVETLTAEPENPKYTYFAGWLTNLTECRTNPVCTFTIKADQEYYIKAIFADYPVEVLHLYVFGKIGGRVISDDGSLSCQVTSEAGNYCQATFVKGSKPILTAIPATGGKFSWRISGCTGTGTCSVLMSKTKTGNVRFY